MKQVILGTIAALAFTVNASATELPFVPDCRMDYSVGSINLGMGLGGGTGTITCNDLEHGEVTTKVDIAVFNKGAAGLLRESGTIYAMGLGLNNNSMLGVLLRAQAAAAIGDYGRAYGAGVMINTAPSVQVFISSAGVKGLGAAFGVGAWFFAEHQEDDEEGDSILDSDY